MHYKLEIIMPPTDDIEGTIEKIMQPFCESNEENLNAFWDFYIIGGRYAGNKLIDSLDEKKLETFDKWLKDQKVTVSGITFGKQELQPKEQEKIVDAKWNEMFPSDPPIPCPYFKHANDQYAKSGALSGTLPGDIMPLKDCMNITCQHLIITHPGWDSDADDWAKPAKEAEFMVQESVWNGVSWIDTTWDGTIKSGLDMLAKKIGGGKPEYIEAATPKDDWIVVTVDYHN